MLNVAIPVETKADNLVTKSNMLIEANYKLGVIEQKIILCLASNIQPNDSDFHTYTLRVKEFCELLGLKGSPKYTELRAITRELMQKVFEIRIGSKVIQVAWLSYVAYNETEGTIDIRFDPFLRPYLLQLKKEFTSYKLENVVKLKSSYSIRIYELLKQYEKIQERTFDLNDLRKLLGAEDVYPKYGNFKQRVLIPAQKELKKKTDISFEIDEIKKGRKVEKVRFRIFPAKRKANKQLSLFEDNQGKPAEEDSYYARARHLALNMGVKISDEVLKNWEKHGRDKVIEALEKVQHRNDIDNLIGYITYVLNFSSNEEVAASSESDSMLLHLIRYFRKKKSKEPTPNWFIEETAVKEIKRKFKMTEEEAESAFKTIRSQLFQALNIEPYEEEDYELEEDYEKRKKEIEERLKKYKR